MYKGKAYAEKASPELFKHIQELIDEADLLVFFNGKFDYHWFRRIGIRLEHKRLFDVQLAEFVVTRQQEAYPSLEGVAVKYGLGHKLDIIKAEYWSKGIDTDQIPWEILQEYAIQDAQLTYDAYVYYMSILTRAQLKLLNLQFMDLHILEEMEWNGLKYNESLCKERSEQLSKKKQELEVQLRNIYPDVHINFGSTDQLSAFLYGGVVEETQRKHDGFYKTGAKAGEPKFRKEIIEHKLPRLYVPIEGSELKKEGLFSTSEDYLKKLKGNKQIVNSLLEISKLDKLISTYYDGIPKKNREMDWEEEMLHGQFNQCVAQTGRLSSSQPNLQNFASELNDILITRY